MKWLPDSRSVILTGVYLPLDTSDSVERAAREEAPRVVEVNVATLEDFQDLAPETWNSWTGTWARKF